MEHKLIPLWPLCDTLAFSLLIWPLFASLPQRPWGIPIYFTESVKIVIYVVTILYIHFSVMHSGNPTRQPGEAKPHRRHGTQHTHSSTTRRRVPPLWMMVIRGYLKVYQFFQFKEPKRRSFVRFDASGNFDCSSSVSPVAPLKASLQSSSLTLLKTLVSGKSCSSAMQPQEFYPQIQFVSSSAVGFRFPHPGQVELFVSGVCWSQHHIDEEQSLVVIYGLKPASAYEIELQFPLNASSGANHHGNDVNGNSMSGDNNNSSNIYTLTMTIVTRSEDSTIVKPRKVKSDSIIEESLELVNSAFADERAVMRRNRREATRQQTNLKREIAEFHAKMPAKLKADDRIRKRIKTLQERLNQKRTEVDSMAAAVHAQQQHQSQQHQSQQLQAQQRPAYLSSIPTNSSSASATSANGAPVSVDPLGAEFSPVAHLAHNVEIRRKEREVQQEELEASLQKWNELEDAKRRELTKLQKRNEKQSERVAKVASSIVRQRAQGVEAVMEYIGALKQERLERKENRLAIEAELISSTQSLR